MARDEAPPFARGESYYNGSVKDPVFSDPINYCGREYRFEVNAQDAVQGYPTANDTSGRAVIVRVVQNVSGAALLPKRVARYKLGAGVPLGGSVDGYTFAAADFPAGVVDEFLPPAGVPNGDFFYLVVDGPTVAKSNTTGTIALIPGDKLQIATGTSTLAADAGYVIEVGGSPTLADELDRIGRADATVATTSTDVAIVANFVHLR